LEPRVSYALVGLFVLALGGVFVVLSLWFLGVGPRGEYRTYAVYLEESVAGITTESPVKYQGVDVGKVQAIGLVPDDPGRVRVLLSVRADAPVTADTVASLSTQGLTGLINYVELTGGGPASAPLEAAPGEPYPRIPAEASLTTRVQRQGIELLDSLQGAGADLRAILAGVRALVGEDNRAAMSATLENARRASAQLAEGAASLQDLLDRLAPLVDDGARFGERLPGLADRAAETLTGVEQTAAELRRLAVGLGQVVERAGPGLVDLSRQGSADVGPLLRELRRLTERLTHLATTLETSPNALIYGRPLRPGPGE
jgi:phospholipid/cholesterol/gamma-HCH transport system substrate-binding protein